jgi:hypothetical protein
MQLSIIGKSFVNPKLAMTYFRGALYNIKRMIIFKNSVTS